MKRILLVGCLAIVLPAAALAQEATISGTVTDATGAVLPGVTVLAVNVASGNQFEAVTDGRGVYRIPVRVGTYRVAAALPGFTRVERAGIQLLVGQTVTLNVQMAPSAIQETVTVTAEAPLIETTQSSVGGNIDPLQMSELPVQGREWMALALLAPGNRTTEIGDEPVTAPREDNPAFALNLDGQQRPVPRLPDSGERAAPPDVEAGGHDGPRRLHVLVRRAGPARPEVRRRVPPFPELQQQLHGHLHGARRPAPDRGPDPGDLPGPAERRHLEPVAHQPARAALRDRDRQLRSSRSAAEVRRLGPGRLARHRPPDAELRAAVRPDLERLCAAPVVRAVDGAQPPAGRQQRPAAARLRLFAQRPDGHPRRVRPVLRGHPGGGAQLGAAAAEGGVHQRGGRRAARLRGEPVQRAAADLPAVARSVLLREKRGRLSLP